MDHPSSAARSSALPAFEALLEDMGNSLDPDEAKRKARAGNESDEAQKRFKSTSPSVQDMLEKLQTTMVAMTHVMKDLHTAVVNQPPGRTMSPTRGVDPDVVSQMCLLQQHHLESTKAVAEAVAKTHKPNEPKIPEEIKASIQKVMKRCGDRIVKTLRSTERTTKAREDLQIMSEHGGRYPAGTRPFKCQTNLVELEEPMTCSEEKDFHFSVCIPQGSSRKEALALLHHSTTKFNKQVNLEALEAKLVKDKMRIKREFIMQECEAVVEELCKVDKLDLDDPILGEDLHVPILKFQEKEYANMIEDIRKKEQKHKQDMIRKKEAEEKTLNDIKDNHPATLMKSVVSNIVADTVKKEVQAALEENMDVAEGEEQSNATPEQEQMVAKMCAALRQKNGKAPGGGRGSTTKTFTDNQQTRKGKGLGTKTDKPNQRQQQQWTRWDYGDGRRQSAGKPGSYKGGRGATQWW